MRAKTTYSAACCHARLPRKRVLQIVDHGRCLLLLQVVDDPHPVLEEQKQWICNSLLMACPADTLALLTSPEQIHWPMIGDQLS